MSRELPSTDTDYDRGFRHGTDGIQLFPGPKCRDQQGYDAGYRAGREFWRETFGSYPRHGDRRWDKK